MNRSTHTTHNLQLCSALTKTARSRSTAASECEYDEANKGRQNGVSNFHRSTNGHKFGSSTQNGGGGGGGGGEREAAKQTDCVRETCSAELIKKRVYNRERAEDGGAAYEPKYRERAESRERTDRQNERADQTANNRQTDRNRQQTRTKRVEGRSRAERSETTDRQREREKNDRCGW